MAEVKVTKDRPGEQESSSREMQRSGQERGELSRWEDRDVGLWADPADLFRMSPFAMMRRMQDDLERMMGDLWHGSGRRSWSPTIEVSEREGNLVVCAELPGLEKDNVKVEATDNALIIEGERRREHEENEKGIYRSERSYGSFRRAVPLPEHAKAEEARADFRNGVLEITIPLAERKARSRRIEIGEGSSERKRGASETPGMKEERKAG